MFVVAVEDHGIAVHAPDPDPRMFGFDLHFFVIHAGFDEHPVTLRRVVDGSLDRREVRRVLRDFPGRRLHSCGRCSPSPRARWRRRLQDPPRRAPRRRAATTSPSGLACEVDTDAWMTSCRPLSLDVVGADRRRAFGPPGKQRLPLGPPPRRHALLGPSSTLVWGGILYLSGRGDQVSLARRATSERSAEPPATSTRRRAAMGNYRRSSAARVTTAPAAVGPADRDRRSAELRVVGRLDEADAARGRAAIGRRTADTSGRSPSRRAGAADPPAQLPGPAGHARRLSRQGGARHVPVHALPGHLPADHVQPARRPEHARLARLAGAGHRRVGRPARRHAGLRRRGSCALTGWWAGCST